MGREQTKRIRWDKWPDKKEKKEEEKRKKKTEERDREKKEGKRGFPLLSKIYEDWTVGFRPSKRQSSSTRRELPVGTKIWEFRQTLKGREFSYLDYFYPKSHLMG